MTVASTRGALFGMAFALSFQIVRDHERQRVQERQVIAIVTPSVPEVAPVEAAPMPRMKAAPRMWMSLWILRPEVKESMVAVGGGGILSNPGYVPIPERRVEPCVCPAVTVPIPPRVFPFGGRR